MHNIALYSVTQERRALVYAATLAFWFDLENSCWFLVAMPLCFSYSSGALATNKTSLTSQVRRLAILENVVLMIGVFFKLFCDGLVPRYATATMQHESDWIGMTGQLGSRFWKLALRVGIFLLPEEFDVDPVLSLFPFARANGINFSVGDDQIGFQLILRTASFMIERHSRIWRGLLSYTLQFLCVIETSGAAIELV